MRITKLVGLALATIGVSGCGTAGSSTPTFVPKALKTADYKRSSWMEHAASGKDLLYIADPDIGGLTVYSYEPPNYARRSLSYPAQCRRRVR
jgi:hypothetical protein